MFAPRYFAPRYVAPRYFAPGLTLGGDIGLPYFAETMELQLSLAETLELVQTCRVSLSLRTRLADTAMSLCMSVDELAGLVQSQQATFSLRTKLAEGGEFQLTLAEALELLQTMPEDLSLLMRLSADDNGTEITQTMFDDLPSHESVLDDFAMPGTWSFVPITDGVAFKLGDKLGGKLGVT